MYDTVGHLPKRAMTYKVEKVVSKDDDDDGIFYDFPMESRRDASISSHSFEKIFSYYNISVPSIILSPTTNVRIYFGTTTTTNVLKNNHSIRASLDHDQNSHWSRFRFAGWLNLFVVFCCCSFISISTVTEVQTSNETQVISTFDIYETNRIQVQSTPANITSTYLPSSPFIIHESTTPNSVMELTKFKSTISNKSKESLFNYQNNPYSITDKHVPLASLKNNEQYFYQSPKTVTEKITIFNNDNNYNNEESTTINSLKENFEKLEHEKMNSLPENYVKLLQPDDSYERYNGNKNKKRPDVSVTIYHHQTIHDPINKYGKGKQWNLYGNGYGVHYGYDLDGNYSRQKGLIV